MNNKDELEKIVYTLLDKNIPVSLAMLHLNEDKIIAYLVDGFSKSGIATLYYNFNTDEIICETRYNKKITINSFEDLSDEAWYWYLSYKDREPFTEPSSYWTPIWVEEGKLKPVTTYVTKFERS